jgi:protein-S-isoprenylcysteine O-methyltransferase Ste14
VPQPVSPPNTIPWPPLIFAGGALAGVLLGWGLPIGGPDWPYLGGAMMLLALGLDASAIVAMRRRRANILPHRAATALVTTFPFNVSRNPIYLGYVLMLAGAALGFANLWLLASAGAAVIAVQQLAILREEVHLAGLFGQAWVDYADRVPRWLRLPFP